MRKMLLLACTAAALVACSTPPEPEVDAAVTATPAPASTALAADNPLKPLLDQRDRARAVEGELDAAAKARREAIDAAGG